mmetsp:Transcript_68948/g.121911  ORF Transcript_68948/g.121911 Transcript_68948/m.121911 type:complete len:231 (-) Transcript_68948:48-740(-)|eukprot:CAMPEP_0197660128 /NCGR_PEP_ID=MMETSP1338-20131121/50623_1 /TAXON_ID=43686 ORGANISM="Pelagodinium beii, Strain RCC1491" /NCGR_SAMPLE_ID=MMETSP1338 /ASSEMBLY_ACC=CAM_ASM_000754 /LENGTH=230 /DNA_ID=CAMNT_0043237409 /DNA_START=43 /DNA_END=735 /DNA_ORIENTATION=+
MAHMMVMKDPRMVDVNHDLAENVFTWFKEFDWNSCQRKMHHLTTSIEQGFAKVEQGFAQAQRQSSQDSTDCSAHLEISSEEGDVWSDEDVKYPSPRDLDTEEPISRRLRKAKTLHTPRQIIWDDPASSSDEETPALPLWKSKTWIEEAFSPACHRAQTKSAALPRSKSLHQLLTDVGQDINAFVLGRAEQKRSKARRRTPGYEVFEIGSEDQDFLYDDGEVTPASSSQTC